jgi:hypothetical protein
MHQLSPVWIDFRGIRDAFMRRRGIDCFENSRRAAYANQAYAIRKRFRDYGANVWGVTASNGPSPFVVEMAGSREAISRSTRVPSF